ncbi:DsbA family protein [Salinarchaeum sp. IM2453]|nr:DsbA family protein [Salinarchaeum sp. IM2453]
MNVKRRTFLGSCGTIGTVGIAGCAALFSSPLPDKLEDISPEDQLSRPTLGDGEVVVETYEDIGCPPCHEFNSEIFPKIQEQYIDTGCISYQHVDFIVMANERSLDLACAARSVQDATQNADDSTGAFFEYKCDLMEKENWSTDTIASVAEDHGVDSNVVRLDIEEKTYYPQLRADWDRASEADVERTPTVIVEDTEIDDPLEFDEIKAKIEEQL